MSGLGPNCSRALRNASFSDKPSYVRCLKFGQSILELDTVEQCHNRVLVVDESVACIPCTEKKEYVRKWIETHGDESDETPSKDTSQSSPILGTSVSSVSVKSPILGSSKRRREKICINRRTTVKKRNQDSWENGGHFAMHFESDCDEENKTKQKRSSEIQRTPPCTENMVADKLSPVLGTCQHRKKKWKKLQCDNLDIDLQREANNNCDSIRNISAIGKLKENENIGIPYRITTIPVICQKYQTIFAPEEERLNLQDSSDSNTDRNNITIEISASEDSRDEACTKLSNSNASTDNNSCLSNLIEDVDTQVATQVVQSSQLTSNKTYCSEVEIMMNQSIHLSAQISQMTSLNRTTQKTGDKLTQTHISSITTPSKKSPYRNIYACILDSGKKRRKPKKGSMVSRLQSLVNAQVSDIRIWRHQMNKKQDAAVQFISVFVHSCRKQFGNQFLDGILLEDRFNLLQSNKEIKETKSHNIQVRSKQASHKFITIMLVCDIVGTLKMISDVVINLYPPWVILDRDNLILEVTYISINDDNEVPDVANKSNLHERKKQIVKEFKCPCIEEERELPFCSRKPSNDKPDMMQKIFEF